MKSLVTGGAGFIGSHLVDRLLDEGHEVVVLDNLSTGRMENLAHLKEEPRFHFYEVDLAHRDTLQTYTMKVDWVFHLAALADIVPSIQKPSPYFSSNVDGTVNILEAARQTNVKRFIYVASSSCYMQWIQVIKMGKAGHEEGEQQNHDQQQPFYDAELPFG